MNPEFGTLNDWIAQVKQIHARYEKLLTKLQSARAAIIAGSRTS
jgi:hypothetical protein